MIHGDYIECTDCQRVTLREWDPSLGRPRDIDKLTRYDKGYDYSYCSYCRSNNVKNGTPQSKFYGYLHMPYKPNDAWNPDHLSDIWKVQGRVINTKNLGSNRGLDDDKMLSIYNLFDIMYYPSGGEGFGMPILEAMACGVPSMYTNYSAHAEVAESAGIPVRCDYVTEMMSSYNRARADTANAVEKTLKILRKPELLKPLRERGFEIANENTWDLIGAQWLKLIDEVAERCSNAIGVVI
jgi:glycosyltransferase involved in cell wall biosynthesis